jgi:hypothetical protein
VFDVSTILDHDIKILPGGNDRKHRAVPLTSYRLLFIFNA